VPEFRIGPIALKNVDFMRLTEGFTADTRIAGNIGANILKMFDVEIDQAARKVIFLSKDHCKGKVVHWPHSDLIDIPLSVGRDGLLAIPVTLDGKELTAMVDTGASASELQLDVAEDKFGLAPGSPGMDRSGTARTLDGALLPQFEHRFETLSIENITFRHPVLMMSEDRSAQSENARRAQRAMRDEPHEMLLGMHQLRQLHLYFAYDEERLYATSVAGDAAAAGSTAQAAAPLKIPDPVDFLAAEKLNGSAMRHANAKEFPAAISDLDHAIALAPGAPGLYNNRAIVYAQSGNSRQAIADFGQAVQIDPQFAGAYLGRANLYLLAGDTDAAIADLSRAIEIKPLAATVALTTRCRLYAARKDFRSALADCGQAVAFAPRNPTALEQRGLVYLATGAVDDAFDDFDAALNLDAHRASSLMGRGLARRRKGDASGARADIAAAREIDPSIEPKGEAGGGISPLRNRAFSGSGGRRCFRRSWSPGNLPAFPPQLIVQPRQDLAVEQECVFVRKRGVAKVAFAIEHQPDAVFAGPQLGAIEFVGPLGKSKALAQLIEQAFDPPRRRPEFGHRNTAMPKTDQDLPHVGQQEDPVVTLDNGIGPGVQHLFQLIAGHTQPDAVDRRGAGQRLHLPNVDRILRLIAGRREGAINDADRFTRFGVFPLADITRVGLARDGDQELAAVAVDTGHLVPGKGFPRGRVAIEIARAERQRVDREVGFDHARVGVFGPGGRADELLEGGCGDRRPGAGERHAAREPQEQQQCAYHLPPALMCCDHGEIARVESLLAAAEGIEALLRPTVRSIPLSDDPHPRNPTLRVEFDEDRGVIRPCVIVPSVSENRNRRSGFKIRLADFCRIGG
jgi:tetratricopeptide (TPR) repeat protein